MTVDGRAATAPAGPGEAALAGVLEEVGRRRFEFSERRQVPPDVVEGFRRAGIYRAATPRRFGGDALPPAVFLKVIERISAVDGSAGWVASFASAGVYLAALPVETQAAIYAGGPDLVFAGGLFPVQPAEPVDGGFRVTGTWRLASGCVAADLLGVGIGVAGSPAGRPRTAVLPPAQVQIVENWDVVGLEGTGSHDLKVDGAYVPEEWTFIRGGAATIDEPLYRYPSLGYAAQVLAVVALGIGRAALDHAEGAGSSRRSLTGGPRPADRGYYRVAIGKAEAELRSARAFFYEMAEEVYAAAEAGTPTQRQAALLRLSAAHAAQAGFEAAQAAYRLCGTAAIYDDHDLQRYLRDASVVPQHAFLSEAMYEGAGAILMDAEAFPGFP